MNIFYSTPSCYLKAVHDAKLQWTTKDDDFFPYASDPHSYWTGYFSSRPTIKFFERMGNNLLQVRNYFVRIYKLYLQLKVRKMKIQFFRCNSRYPSNCPHWLNWKVTRKNWNIFEKRWECCNIMMPSLELRNNWLQMICANII